MGVAGKDSKFLVSEDASTWHEVDGIHKMSFDPAPELVDVSVMGEETGDYGGARQKRRAHEVWAFSCSGAYEDESDGHGTIRRSFSTGAELYVRTELQPDEAGANPQSGCYVDKFKISGKAADGLTTFSASFVGAGDSTADKVDGSTSAPEGYADFNGGGDYLETFESWTSGVNATDWSKVDGFAAGSGCTISQVAHSAVAGNKLTSSPHIDNCALFENDPTNKSWTFFTYKDPRQGTHRFNGDTDQSIWASWHGKQVYQNPRHPNLDIGLRYAEDQATGYWMVAGANGVFICNQVPGGNYGRYRPFHTGQSYPYDSSARAYHQIAQADDDWFAMKLRVEPSGSDQIIHGYIATGYAAVNSADSFGEPTWTEVITMTHKASGADVCTLGTYSGDFAGDPITTGKPAFVINGSYAGYGSYAFGKIYVDSVGVKLN